MPFLGLCLGHQLLAEALGGSVGKSIIPEIGVCEVRLTEAGASGILCDGLPERMRCLQWYGAEIKKLPARAKVLATSPDCAVQAMSWGPGAYWLQFHIEIEQNTLQDWGKILGYAASLTSALGANGQKMPEAACADHMHAFNAMAEHLFLNWLQIAARA